MSEDGTDGSTNDVGSKPYKVVSCKGTKRFGVVASSLKELVEKGQAKLELDPSTPVRVVLELDATEVDDEDYFRFLEPQTAFVLLSEDEEYVPLCMRDRIDGLDETDSVPPEFEGDAKTGELIQALRLDLTKIVTFSPEDLQRLLSVSEGDLSSYLDTVHGALTARQVREACQRFLDEHQQAQDYMSILNLLQQGTTDSSQDLVPENKKRRQDSS